MTDDRAAIDDDETQPEAATAEPEVSTREKRFEVIATFLLAFAALATLDSPSRQLVFRAAEWGVANDRP